jgi:hypothetical protein
VPRKDRRFTGEDLRRIYCRNLTAEQRYLFDCLDCDWDRLSNLEKARRVLDTVLNLLEPILDAIPYGGKVRDALDFAVRILSLINRGIGPDVLEIPDYPELPWGISTEPNK